MKTPNPTASTYVAHGAFRHASGPDGETLSDRDGDQRLPNETWMTDRDSLDGGLPDSFAD